MDWFLANSTDILTLAGQHFVLVVLPMVLGLMVSIALAQAARQDKVLRSVVVTASSLLSTVPSLALFIILPTILGTRILDPLNVVVALGLYAALLGIGNLGMLFTSGLHRGFITEVVVGIVAILVLALLMDAVLVVLERLLTPWTRAGAATGLSRRLAGGGAWGTSSRIPWAGSPIRPGGPVPPGFRRGWPNTCSTPVWSC